MRTAACSPAALFVNDVERPGMLHVAFLRSPHAHDELLQSMECFMREVRPELA